MPEMQCNSSCSKNRITQYQEWMAGIGISIENLNFSHLHVNIFEYVNK